MNVLEAAKATVYLARAKDMGLSINEELDDSLTLQHLEEMLVKMNAGGMSYGKMCRWLGWMQAAVVASGVATLEDMKRLNEAWSKDPEPDPVEQVRAAMKAKGIPFLVNDKPTRRFYIRAEAAINREMTFTTYLDPQTGATKTLNLQHRRIGPFPSIPACADYLSVWGHNGEDYTIEEEHEPNTR